MRIVRPTEPPSMAVIVETLFMGERHLTVLPADPLKPRIDTVFADSNGIHWIVGIASGYAAIAPTPPVLWPGRRAIAHLHIKPAAAYVVEKDIEELDLATRVHRARRAAAELCECGHRRDRHLPDGGLCMAMDSDGLTEDDVCQCIMFDAADQPEPQDMS